MVDLLIGRERSLDDFEFTILLGEDSLDPVDDNVDVEVELSDGRRYSATFFTIENLRTLIKRYEETGECRGGLYVWAVDMIVIKILTREAIEEAIEDMLRTGEFFTAFSELE